MKYINPDNVLYIETTRLKEVRFEHVCDVGRHNYVQFAISEKEDPDAFKSHLIKHGFRIQEGNPRIFFEGGFIDVYLVGGSTVRMYFNSDHELFEKVRIEFSKFIEC